MRNFRAAACLQRRRRTRALNGAMDVTLTDGGIGKRIIYEFKRPIGDFEAYQLLADEAGRHILRRIYQGYAQVAVRYGLPIQLGTPTWRASGRLRGKKCYNFRLDMPEWRAAYCMSQGQPTLLLVVHQDSQVVCAGVHKYSHIIENFNPPSSP